MSESRKSKILIDASYNNGEELYKEHPAPCLPALHLIPGTTKFKEIRLRIVVDSRNAEDLLEGIFNGQVTLDIVGMPSAIERDSKG